MDFTWENRPMDVTSPFTHVNGMKRECGGLQNTVPWIEVIFLVGVLGDVRFW